MNKSTWRSREPLALALSQIHRSRSIEELQDTFVRVAPQFINADAYGFYLFDEEMRTSTVITQFARRDFISEYEAFRDQDPLFINLVREQTFTHSLGLFDKGEWHRQPLHDFLTRWGLDYSIEAPLVYEGKINGTLNFAIGGGDYFAEDGLHAARFLCSEIDFCYRRIMESRQGDADRVGGQPPGQAVVQLGERSREILELLLKGMKNRAISSALHISENTVRYHIKQIYRVFKVHNRAQLAQSVYSANRKLN